MATKIRLKRMGKKFYAFYRVVITDSRNKRDGQSIEEIGTYNPNTQPSTIQIDSERAQYWLGVGAQPSEPVLKLLKITGEVTESTALVPFVDEMVPDIDLEEGYLTIDPPGGLIPGL